MRSMCTLQYWLLAASAYRCSALRVLHMSVLPAMHADTRLTVEFPEYTVTAYYNQCVVLLQYGVAFQRELRAAQSRVL
jgi:hypothetical protein